MLYALKQFVFSLFTTLNKQNLKSSCNDFLSKSRSPYRTVIKQLNSKKEKEQTYE